MSWLVVTFDCAQRLYFFATVCTLKDSKNCGCFTGAIQFSLPDLNRLFFVLLYKLRNLRNPRFPKQNLTITCVCFLNAAADEKLTPQTLHSRPAFEPLFCLFSVLLNFPHFILWDCRALSVGKRRWHLLQDTGPYTTPGSSSAANFSLSSSGPDFPSAVKIEALIWKEDNPSHIAQAAVETWQIQLSFKKEKWGH